MKKLILKNLMALLAIGLFGCSTGLTDLTVSNDMTVSGNATITGTLTQTGAVAFAGDITASGGAGALTFDDSASSIVVPDGDATALLIGSTGYLGLITLDTTDDAEEVNIVGKTAVSTFRVDTGFATFDEQAVLSAGADVGGDILAGGAAGALTFDAASSSVVYTDASGTGLVMGSAGHLNLITLDSTNDQETLIVTGETAVDAFHVDVGTSQFDENVDVTGGVDITGALSVSTTTDQNGDLSCGGGAGALTFDAASSSVVYTDGSATGLIFGSAGHTNLLTLDSTDDQETLIVTGETAVLAFKVDVGTTEIDETLKVSGATDQDGDLSCGGGAGALTFDAASSSIVYTDASGTGLVMGSTGHLNLITLDSTNDQETLIVTGETAVDAFHVDVGTSLFDEDAVFGAGITVASPAILHQNIRFCGNGPDGGTETFLSPNMFADIDGSAACDAEDDTTIGNADEPWPLLKDVAFKPLSMVCTAVCTAGTADDAFVFRLMDDTAAVTGMTCTTSAVGGDASPVQCTVTDTTPETVAAGSLLAIGVDSTNDDCNDAGDDFTCMVYVTY
jgi:hypothetical protein